MVLCCHLVVIFLTTVPHKVNLGKKHETFFISLSVFSALCEMILILYIFNIWKQSPKNLKISFVSALMLTLALL